MRVLALRLAVASCLLLLNACGVNQLFSPTATPAVVVIVATPNNQPATTVPATAVPAATPATAAPAETATAATVAGTLASAVTSDTPTLAAEPTLAAAATQPPAAGTTPLCVAGSNSVLGSATADMQAAWAEALAARFNIQLQISGEGSEAAVEAALAGECVDALIASEPLNSGQLEQLQEAGINAGEPTIFGNDAIVFVTNRANPAPALGLDQIAAILNGDTTNWSQVGGAEQPIRVLLRPGSGTTNYVLVNVAEFEPFVTVPGQPFPPKLAYTECGSEGGNSACLEQVAATEGAFYWAARYLVRGGGVRPVPVRDRGGAPVDPTGLAFDLTSYPAVLVRPLYLYVLGRSGGNPDSEIAASTFRAYLLSAPGQQTLVDQGFFSIAP